LYGFVGNAPIDRIDPLGMAEMNPRTRTLTVDRCEIAIFYGHQNPEKPWKFSFNGSCSAGAAITCWPTLTNGEIPTMNQIPGAPIHNERTWFYGENPTSETQLFRQEQPPETDFDVVFPEVLKGAISKAAELCTRRCCKEVKIVFFRRGSLIPGDKVPPLKNNLRYDCATRTVTEEK
jgi:hypothetical protein